MNDIAIDDPVLGLKPRISFILNDVGIPTLQVAATKSDAELLKWRGIGRKCLKQLKIKAAELGVRWTGGTQEEKHARKFSSLYAKIRELKETNEVLQQALDKQERLADHYMFINRNLEGQIAILEALTREESEPYIFQP